MTIPCCVVIIRNSVLWSLYEGCVPKVCIGYITNGLNYFATVNGFVS